MSHKISPMEIIEHVAFGSLGSNVQAIVYSVAAPDKVGVPHVVRMTADEITKLKAVQDKFYPIRRSGGMLPRFANERQPTSPDEHDWEFKPSFGSKTYIVRYYDRSHYADLYVDQTSVDEENEQLIWRLFEEFGHKQTEDTFDEIEPVVETDDSGVNQIYESLKAAIDAAGDESHKTMERPLSPQIAEPIKDGEGSHLFTILEIYEMKTWANGYLKAVDAYLEIKNFVEDDWVEYKLPSGEIADVQFSRNNDEQSPSYEMIEVFAYRTKANSQGNRITDSDDCVRLF